MSFPQETSTAIRLAELLVASAIWMGFPGGAYAAEAGPRPYVIVAFGDSLTASTQVAKELRWTSLLETMLRKNVPDRGIVVFNAGGNGNTSREGLVRMENDVLARRPNLVLVEFVNDATFQPARHVSLEEFARNCREMHDRIVRQAGAQMLCWPCTPILNAKHAWGKHPFYASAGGIDDYQNSYRKCLAEVCRELRMPLVDMDTIFRNGFKDHGEDFYILPDGIHYREAGNRLIADSLLPEVEKLVRNSRK